ncbi:granzyme B isoform X2 [Chelonia mydas]|uniref:granzyme B isoform X2 n=1 Tax=Chelonia mydas TaxID=8469 RepID=UPI0018A1FE1D|nr:granzyme B isoform X2 [Chelonia mydas]
MQAQILLLLPMAFLLPPRAWAGEIIGGKNAKPHSRPYMAYLDIQRRNKLINCGGFLVAENFVLTAAHCNGDKITVKLGAHNISKQERSQQEIPVCRHILHPQYDSETTNNDIMLLQLAETVKLNKWVKTIPLPRTNKREKPGTKCSVAGWGRTSKQSESAPATTLQEANLKVLEDDVCLKNPDVTYYDYDASTMMCVGDPKKGKASFRGDSGGPLVCGKRAQGIVSWGSQNSASPGVYTRVSTFISWIKETMRMLEPQAEPGIAARARAAPLLSFGEAQM